MVGTRSELESIVQHNLVRHAGIGFGTAIHYPLDVLVLINALVETYPSVSSRIVANPEVGRGNKLSG
jgi:hypothetical protein